MTARALDEIQVGPRLLEPPGIEEAKCLAHVMVCAPEPEDAVLVREARDIEQADALDGFRRVG
jgi:hypothetical protein